MGKKIFLEMKNIKKYFGGVQALKGVDFQVCEKEVIALVGENGAGKSTLMRILGGACVMDEGEIYIDCKNEKITSPIEAQRLGIAVIYQEQSLVNSLTIADNIMLGRIPNRMGWINKKKLIQKASEFLKKVDVDFDPNREVGTLTLAQKQFVEIAKALSTDARVIIMDEPSSVLTKPEIEKMFKLIKEMKKQGHSIIYISHRLEEIFEISDRCSVLKDGVMIGTVNTSDVDKLKLIKMMTGREIIDIYPPKSKTSGEIKLKVEGLTRKGVFDDVWLHACAGEVVGISGLVGSGRTEVARAIFGVDLFDKGTVILNGKKVEIKSPQQAINLKMVYISEDRKKDGLILQLPVRDNITLSTIKKFAKMGFINFKKEKNSVMSMVEQLEIKVDKLELPVEDLSGGNQQKVMIAKGMLVNADVIIIDEPTRGVDIKTKPEIYKIIRSLTEMGKAVIMISSELPEIIGMSDRILVMHRGHLVGEISGEEATEELIMLFATGSN